MAYSQLTQSVSSFSFVTGRPSIWLGVWGLSLGCGGLEQTAHPSKQARDTGSAALDSEAEDERPDPLSQPEAEDTGEPVEPEHEQEETAAEDAAEMVSVDLPAALDCGETAAATVTMRNTGTATWTRDGGYKLGAVGDSDVFYTGDTRVWLEEGVEVGPGQVHRFEFELTAPMSEGSFITDWQMVHEDVQWFGATTAQEVGVACSEHTWCDPLTDASVRPGFSAKVISGGSLSAAGWQTTGSYDQVRLEMDTPVSGSGSLQIDVSNFDPDSQYSSTKHQIINMYTTDNGSQDVFDTDEAWWNIRTGTNYGTGLKILAAPNGGDSREEARLIADASWNPLDVHTFAVRWDASEVSIYLDGTHLETLDYSGRVQPLQHVFLGTDNVYVAQVGPIYSNLCVTQ